ncbi:SRPBCC family protein [Bradyrhizobium sp.]|uniref:SRPBCC family protein n=1 Tax=Bradyrhizobium sp. TaxID=376 RepID=UPI003C73C3E7
MAPKSNVAGDAGLSTRPSLSFKRRLNASPEKVYAAWTDPEKIIRWFGRSDANANSFRAEIDARVGGRFRVSFATDAEYYEVGGVYREVVPNQRLVFSWAWHSTPERESLVTVSLKPDGDGTLLTLVHEQLFDQAARDGHERGWIGALDKLEQFTA